MNKLYNTQKDFTIGFKKFLLQAIPNIRKTQLNIFPYIILGMILSESCVPVDIAKELKSGFSFVQIDSIIKRIRRFFNNKLFKPYEFYNNLISFVINDFKLSHTDKNIYITLLYKSFFK